MMNKNYLKLVVAFLTITVFLTGCLFKNKTSNELTNNELKANQENTEVQILVDELENENDPTLIDNNINNEDIIIDEEALKDKDLIIDTNTVIIESDTSIKTEIQNTSKTNTEEVIFEKYQIQDETTASYTVQKKWFSKPSESVTGITQNVDGSFMYASKTGELKDLIVNIDSQTFDTGSGGRDKVVKELFDGPITVALKNLKIKTGSTTIPMDLTINGKTQKTNFAITTKLKDKLLTGTGSANIKLSQFEIEPPSLLNVYTVDDALVVSFEMSAMVK